MLAIIDSVLLDPSLNMAEKTNIKQNYHIFLYDYIQLLCSCGNMYVCMYECVCVYIYIYIYI